MMPLTIRRTLASLFLLALLAASASAQHRRMIVRGTVETAEGRPLPFATVQVRGTRYGGVSDRDGRFLFVLADAATATLTLSARSVGYEQEELTVHPDEADNDTITVSFVLNERSVSLNEIVVTASSYGSGEMMPEAALRPLDVVTTSGAAADVFRALQTLPGVAVLDDGAGLYVRGGDVHETLTLLDQATVTHPYKYETPTGGMFGTIPPFLLDGMYFSAGGFPARYGNALSGVLAMQSLNLPDHSSLDLNLGLGAASAGGAIVVEQESIGIRFSGNISSADILFRVNGALEDFRTPPQGGDGNLSLIYRYSPSGGFKLFTYVSTETIGVRVPQPSFQGVYEAKETGRLHNLQWSDALGAWAIRTSLSFTGFDSHSRLGAIDLNAGDATHKLRIDIEREFGSAGDPWLRLFTGGEIEHLENRLVGTVPSNSLLLDKRAPIDSLDERYDQRRVGIYVESEARITRRLFANLGLRSDVHTTATTFDPRISLRYELFDGASARAAWGIYHQGPRADQLNAETGAPDLQPETAIHRIVGVEYRNDELTARIEAYDKSYAKLILRDSTRNLANRGDGVARGLDLFVKYGTFLETPLNGWLSYSFLHTRRTQVRDLGTDIAYENAPTPFDITHAITLVAKYRLVGFLNIGATLRYAAGAPITPIVDAIHDIDRGLFIPVEGPLQSERLPPFARIDADLSYYLPFGGEHFAVFYAAVINLTNRRNILGYDYSADYSAREPRTTSFERSFYCGASVMIRL